MAYRNDRDDFRDPRRGRPRSEGELGGDYARDDWNQSFGGDYARDDDRRGLSGYYARDPRWFGEPRHPAEWQNENPGGGAQAFAVDDRARSYRGRGPKNYRRSDERIAEEINELLTDDHHVDATDIDVSVSDGEVTLEGAVATRSMKRRAEDIAMSCGGVRDVHNRLHVTHTWEDVKLGKASE